MKVTDIAKQMLLPYLKEKAIIVDFTLGNGHDSRYFLSYPITKLYGFEIQEDVYKETSQSIQDPRAFLFCDGHENVLNYIQEPIDAGIFNFGYCPSGNKNITTILETSKQAVLDALSLLKVKGTLVLVMYIGHEEGKKEAAYFEGWAKLLPSKHYNVIRISMENKVDCPFILGIEKVR